MKKNITKEVITSVDKFVLDNYGKYKTDETWIVTDGVVDLNSYNHSKYRILWVLKEINEVDEGDDNSMFGDWDIRDAFNRLISEEGSLKGWTKTLSPIILSTYGILNDMYWDGIDNIEEKNYKIKEVLKNIAYINMKKEPGKSVADANELAEKYNRDKSVILHQIDQFDPDIIIFGNTLDYIKEGLELREENVKHLNDINAESDKFSLRLNYPKFYIQNEKIYIDAYHPSFYPKDGHDKQKYVDGIINAVKYWKKMKSL